MIEKSRRNVTHRSAVERVRDAETFAVTLPVVGQVRIPRPDQLAYYGALAGLAALVIGAGHALAASQHHKVAQELGEALQDA